MILNGGAAKNARRAELVARGTPEDMLDELTAAVGLPGQPFYTTGGARLQHGATLMELPEQFAVDVAQGQQAAQAALGTYHSQMCNGHPQTADGRKAALDRGWAGPQQWLALEGHHRSSRRWCNLAITVRQDGEPVAILAISGGRRKCVVQAIHAVPKVRGPLCLPQHMWERAKTCVRAQSKALVRCSLELPCCQSQQGAAFWITRMGWDGTDEAKQAAEAWGRGEKWSVGTYELWYTLPAVEG